jgi:hypothetical protein
MTGDPTNLRTAPSTDFKKAVKSKADEWKKSREFNQNWSYAVSLTVILAGLASSALSLAGDQSMKIWGGLAGAVVVAAKSAGDSFKFTTKAESFRLLHKRAEGISIQLDSFKDANEQDLRNKFISLLDIDAGGSGT